MHFQSHQTDQSQTPKPRDLRVHSQGPEVRARSIGSDSLPVNGLVWFTDGSAMYPGHRILRRAAWGTIALGAEGMRNLGRIRFRPSMKQSFKPLW
eukprot:3223256-Amphidinium_carterae.1